MRRVPFRFLCLSGLCTAAPAGAASGDDIRTLERVNVVGRRPASLPAEIPTTTESISGALIDRSVNASDAEDALKYLPSLVVRKRYIGDYDHAVLATRASGTGNSARSLVYADGVLLSNLLGNGAAYTPRWGLVTAEEIDRVDVLYGPFSAAYPGNSAGAVVDYVTRMPERLEAHVKLQGTSQPYRLDGTDARYGASQASASIGSRSGAWSWWLNVNHLDADAQPLSFATKTVASGTAPGGNGAPVQGAAAGRNPQGAPWWLFGATGQTHTVQDHARVKLAWDIAPGLRATYSLASWRNEAQRGVQSFVADASGVSGAGVLPGAAGSAPVPVFVDGRQYTLSPSDFARTRASMEHLAQSIGLRRERRGDGWGWEATASVYDYRRDQVRSSALALSPAVVSPAPAAFQGVTDQSGSGWNTLALKASWRAAPGHLVEGGWQREAFTLRSLVSRTADWQSGDIGAPVYRAAGETVLTSLWVQDAWQLAADWKALLGLRAGQWQARDGSATSFGTSGESAQRYADRRVRDVSPKAALSFAASERWTLKASLGRAVRMPTVTELYQGAVSLAGSTAGTALTANDPALRPERSWTSELTAERELDAGLLRTTVFIERTVDALYSQPIAGTTFTTVQNIGAVRTHGIELALQARDAGLRGLDLSGSLTYADSRTVRNDANPASVGRWQPRVPQWRAAALADWRVSAQWSTSLGARFSGRQYGQLDNSDVNADAYTGFSRYLVADVRVQWAFAPQCKASVGIDNLSNARYWAFHPYPQRTFNAELRWDL